jgi:hypothetical protein
MSMSHTLQSKHMRLPQCHVPLVPGVTPNHYRDFTNRNGDIHQTTWQFQQIHRTYIMEHELSNTSLGCRPAEMYCVSMYLLWGYSNIAVEAYVLPLSTFLTQTSSGFSDFSLIATLDYERVQCAYNPSDKCRTWCSQRPTLAMVKPWTSAQLQNMCQAAGMIKAFYNPSCT